MQKVIAINLNGNAYQVDEAGFDMLRDYLAGAERELEGNPDRAEILADLEQAIADKCQRYLGPHKSVVTASEVSQILAEMGPVSNAGPAAGSSGTTTTPPIRRLYRIADGAMIGGVCTGLAAYFKVDVTLIRIAFVVLALLTKGVGILAYVIVMFVVPEANTPEEQAAAGSAPFNAKEVVDRVKREYAEGSKRWNREWRRQRRQWRQRHGTRPLGWRAAGPAYPPPAWSLVLFPVSAVVHVALFLVATAMLVSLVNTGTFFGWPLPDGIPEWAGVLLLFFAYQLIVSPFRAVRHWAWRPGGGPVNGWFAFWNAAVWLVGLAVIVWVASSNLPALTEFLQRFPELIRDMLHEIRDFFRR